MQHRHIIANHGCLTDDNGMRMIDHQTFADHRTGMDVDAKYLGNA